MLERFEISEIFETNENVERLDEGIYLEHITVHPCIDTDTVLAESVFGEVRPDQEWWKESMKGAVQEGFIDFDGLVSWHTLGQYFCKHGLTPDYMDGISLENLLEMLDEGDKVICALNDLVLEIPQAASLPSVFPNQFVWVTGVDLSDPGRETVIVVKPLWNDKEECVTEQWPLENFLKAWMTGNKRMMSVGMEVCG